VFLMFVKPFLLKFQGFGEYIASFRRGPEMRTHALIRIPKSRHIGSGDL
jgi:hypothetical protein